MAGYTRNDTSNNIATGNIINASDLDGEFDAIQTAFDATSGHNHDGTVGEGVPITVIGPAQEYVGTVTEFRPKSDNTYDLGTTLNEWKDLWIDGTATIDTLQVDENATVTGNFTVNGNTTLGNATTDTVTITAEIASSLIPSTDNLYDLGSTSKEWKDLWIDGTANIDTLTADAGTVGGSAITTTDNTQTLTNKTINLSNNTLVATSAQLAAALTDETGTGAAVFAGSPALTGTPTAPTAAAATNTTQIATTAHVFAERTNAATLTNKTFDLSSNTLVATSAQLATALTDETGTGVVVFSNSPALTGTPTAPTAAAATNTTQIATTAHVFAERTNTAALTNKTISVDDNTVSGIAASSFVLSNASGNIDGSAAQKAIPTGVVVGTTDTQTLTNKTLNTATLNSPTINTLVNVAGNSNFDSGTLYVDGTNDRVGIGITSPTTKLHITALAPSTFTSLVRINGAYPGAGSHGIGLSINSFDTSAGIFANPVSLGAELVFATATDYTTPTLTERMRITKDGYVGIGRTPASGIELDVSGEIRTSVGILFGTDTAAANTLDGYEEGTWSPVLTDGTNNATMSASAGGAYTKIGRMVTVTGRVITTALGSVTGPVFVSGLPFTAGATVGRGTASFGGTSGLSITAGQSITGRILPSATRIELYLWDSAVGQTAVQATEWSDDGDSYFSATYFTA